MYTALWTAYPLTADHISGSASNSTWTYNPNPAIAQDHQINVKSNSYETNYGNGLFSRGHQLPAADRKCDSDLRAQTYYLTNQTPQIQEGFNSPMWSNLEQAIRDLTSGTDTVYVVTGAAFQQGTTTESITYLIPVPNYYWKVLLKVKWSSGDNKTVVQASAIGIWMKHQTYTNNNAWQTAVCSVSQIESYTGFDFFANLPDDLEQDAELNTSWSDFQGF